MFNSQAFVNDIHNQSVPGVASKMDFTSSNKRALLYVFTPSMIPTQVLRPYRYNFTENLVDELSMQSEVNLQRAVAPNKLGSNSVAVNTAIMPTPNGISLNTSTWSSQWTFVLIIDTQPTPTGNRIALASPMNRIIATGFCTEEPINPATKTINPNAVLIFTKTSSTNVHPNIGPSGVSTTVANMSDLDVVSELNGQMANGTDLYMGSPQDIRGMITSDPTGGTVGAYGSLCLSNVKAGDSNKIVDRRMSTPKIQLGNIMNVIDSAVKFAKSNYQGLDNYNVPREYDDPISLAKAAFDQNINGSNVIMPASGIDTSMPMTMQQLSFIFSNSLDIVPIQLMPTSPWDSTPQDAMTARNSMSSLVSASLSNLLPACTLSNIFFTYQSFSQTGPTMIDPNVGVWQIDDYGMLVDVPPIKQEAAINLFKSYFEMEIVPILKLVRGDFKIMCYCDCCGYILIDLLYMADQGMQLGEGFYETTSKLGGFINPMVMNLDTLNHNATQLDQMVTKLVGNKLGPGQFGRPIIGPDNYDPFGNPIPTSSPVMQATVAPSAPVQPIATSVTVPPPTTRADYSGII